MIAVILAGGFATRMYPLTRNKAKSLLPVNGKPILEWLVDGIVGDSRIDCVHIITNSKFYSDFFEWLDAYRHPDKDKIYIHRTSALSDQEKKGAIGDFIDFLRAENFDKEVFWIAADNYLDFSLNTMVDFYYEQAREICVWGYEENNTDKLRKTGVAITDHGHLISFEEKPESPGGHIAIPPFYIYSPRVIRVVKDMDYHSLRGEAPGFLLEWLQDFYAIDVMPMPGRRIDCGTLAEYYRLCAKFDSAGS